MHISKDIVSTIFSTALCIMCTSFVAHKGYKCIKKYKSEPESVDIKYEFTGDIQFPSLTFCPNPLKLKEDVLISCNLTLNDYVSNNRWIGSGSNACSNPHRLKNQISPNIEDLNIEKFQIYTFDQNMIAMDTNDSSLIWETLAEDFPYHCFTVSMPREIINLGIQLIEVDLKKSTNLVAYVHLQGLLSTDMSDSWPEVYLYGAYGTYGYIIPVGHEIVQLQKYNKKPCIDDINYQLDKCRLEYIQRVSQIGVHCGKTIRSYIDFDFCL